MQILHCCLLFLFTNDVLECIKAHILTIPLKIGAIFQQVRVLLDVYCPRAISSNIMGIATRTKDTAYGIRNNTKIKMFAPNNFSYKNSSNK